VLGEREVASRAIGEIVMEELRQLDEVAYVRYASVYHRFHDVDSFRAQLEQLDKSRRSDPAGGQLPLLPSQARDPRGKR
jgi:transcriptional repressor NrdR